MGLLGKVLTGTAIGVGAIALAPFTGGGSLAAGATLGASLAGAGTVAAAAGAGVAGAVAGAVAQEFEDDDKQEQILEAKKASFEDGVYEGKSQTIEELEKIHSYILGSTMFSYYVARVDGELAYEEELEIDHDLNAFMNNYDLPDELVNKLNEISKMEKIKFSEVRGYLDRISVDSLAKFDINLQEIIEADGTVTPHEEKAQQIWREYYETRKKNESC